MIFRSRYLDRVNDLSLGVKNLKEGSTHLKIALRHFFFAARFFFFWTWRTFFRAGWKRDFLFTAPHRLIQKIQKQNPEHFFSWLDFLHCKLIKRFHGSFKKNDRTFMIIGEFEIDRNDFDRSAWKWIWKEKEFWGGNDHPTTFIVERVVGEIADIVSLNGLRFACPVKALYPEFLK